MGTREKICITLDRNMLKEVRQIAKREDRSISYVVNLFVRDGIRSPARARKLIQRTPGKYARN